MRARIRGRTARAGGSDWTIDLPMTQLPATAPGQPLAWTAGSDCELTLHRLPVDVMQRITETAAGSGRTVSCWPNPAGGCTVRARLTGQEGGQVLAGHRDPVEMLLAAGEPPGAGEIRIAAVPDPYLEELRTGGRR